MPCTTMKSYPLVESPIGESSNGFVAVGGKRLARILSMNRVS